MSAQYQRLKENDLIWSLLNRFQKRCWTRLLPLRSVIRNIQRAVPVASKIRIIRIWNHACRRGWFRWSPDDVIQFEATIRRKQLDKNNERNRSLRKTDPTWREKQRTAAEIRRDNNLDKYREMSRKSMRKSRAANPEKYRVRTRQWRLKYPTRSKWSSKKTRAKLKSKDPIAFRLKQNAAIRACYHKRIDYYRAKSAEKQRKRRAANPDRYREEIFRDKLKRLNSDERNNLVDFCLSLDVNIGREKTDTLHSKLASHEVDPLTALMLKEEREEEMKWRNIYKSAPISDVRIIQLREATLGHRLAAARQK